MIDPYKILNIHKNFTLEELKEAYKIAALQVHPDKGGNEHLFKLVTDCYKTLKNEYNNNTKSHEELKNVYKTNKRSVPIDPIRNNNFNIAKFNELFMENHTKNKIDEIGYQDFLKEDLPKQKEYNKKYNNKNFNKFFDEEVAINKKNKYLMKYREPQPMSLSTSCSYLVLGQDNIDDFSSDPLKNGLNYTDLKIAHTTSKIIDHSTVKQRKNYNNIEELIIDRDKIKYTMTEKEQKYYDRKQEKEKKKELELLKKIKNEDDINEEKYNRIMKIFNQLK